jgi:type II secretory pathway predicted ATPase ExeA
MSQTPAATMYLAFFGLREAPFRLSLDPAFLYLSAAHQVALTGMLEGVRRGCDVIALTGEAGTGKSLLLRAAVDALAEEIRLADLRSPPRGRSDLLESLAQAWAVSPRSPGGEARAAAAASDVVLADALREFAADMAGRGRRLLVVIDEAHALADEVLDALDALPGTQALLAGQPELGDRLWARDRRGPDGRSRVHHRLAPLSPDGVRAYIEHRLRRAGATRVDLFTDEALQAIAEYSDGAPRLVSTLCDVSLLGGYAEGRRRIDAELVREAIRYLDEGERPRWSRLKRMRLMPSHAFVRACQLGVAALIGVLLAVVLYVATALRWFGAAGDLITR